MPRSRKPTITGAPAQSAQTAPGLPYGEAQIVGQAQQDMPLPDNLAHAPATPGPGTPSPLPATPGPYEGSSLQQAALATMFDPVNIGAPNDRLDHPVTSGVPVGPGSNIPAGVTGPRPKMLSETLAELADSEPSLAGLANYARSQGL